MIQFSEKTKTFSEWIEFFKIEKHRTAPLGHFSPNVQYAWSLEGIIKISISDILNTPDNRDNSTMRDHLLYFTDSQGNNRDETIPDPYVGFINQEHRYTQLSDSVITRVRYLIEANPISFENFCSIGDITSAEDIAMAKGFFERMLRNNPNHFMKKGDISGLKPEYFNEIYSGYIQYLKLEKK